MNKFTELDIKPVYDSDDNIKEFYNEVLIRAKEYKRASAYFSNGFYNYIQMGLFPFVKSGGKMKLIISTEVDTQVINDIKKGIELKNDKCLRLSEFIQQYFLNTDDFSNNISLLSYLIALDRLEIKFVFKNKGLFHDKFSLFFDNYSNILLASGSNNETIAAVELNHESFETTINWNTPSKHELLKIYERNNKFDDTWDNKIPSLLVLPMYEVIKEKLIEKIESSNLLEFDKNLKFVRLSIDEENVIRIQSNQDKNTILDQYKFNIIKPFIESTNQTTIKLRPIYNIKDIIEIRNITEYICNKLGFTFVETDSYKNFINSKTLDLDKLSIFGQLIKNSSELQKNNDFITFTNSIQNLLKRPLKFAQLQSAYHIVKVKRVMNFSVPGSGKTSTVLGAFEYLNALPLSDPNHIDKLLVFGPINCFKAWQEEYEIVSKKFEGNISNQILNISEGENKGIKKVLLKYNQSRLTLVNFDSIVSTKNFLKEFVDEKVMVVFDEIHRVKNYNSDKLPAMIEIIDKSKYRVALSGTPLPNGYKDLYAMFSLLYGEYAQIYFNMYIDNLSKADVDFENSGLESQEISQKIQPFFTRVSKHDLNVPLSNPDHLVEIETNEMENKLYIQLLNSSNSSFGKSIKLTQLACLSESIDLLNEPSDYDINSFISSNETNFIKQINDVNFSFGNSSKINKLVDLIISLNRKVVVWCVFVDTINKITTILNKKGIATINIYGVTNYNERSNIINDFNNNKSIKVLVTNPHTLAESVSLHKACHDAVYVELNYNLSHYLQSRDRIHRLGLKPNQQTNYFILINNYMGDKNKSIDYLIYKRLIKKEKRMMKAIDGGALLYRDKVGNYEFDELVNEIKTNIKI